MNSTLLAQVLEPEEPTAASAAVVCSAAATACCHRRFRLLRRCDSTPICAPSCAASRAAGSSLLTGRQGSSFAVGACSLLDKCTRFIGQAQPFNPTVMHASTMQLRPQQEGTRRRPEHGCQHALHTASLRHGIGISTALAVCRGISIVPVPRRKPLFSKALRSRERSGS